MLPHTAISREYGSSCGDTIHMTLFHQRQSIKHDDTSLYKEMLSSRSDNVEFGASIIQSGFGHELFTIVFRIALSSSTFFSLMFKSRAS